MTIFTDNSKVNENLLAENDVLKLKIKTLDDYVDDLRNVNKMKEEAFNLLKTQNDALMLEKIRLMDTNMRLITEIEAYNVYVLNNVKVGVK